MTLFHLFLVAAIQGITEFLPVSSSGHLILLPLLTGMADQGQAIDVAVHVGTLGAVVAYFWSDVAMATAGFGRLLRGRIDTAGAFLALCLVVATIPVVVVGLLLSVTGVDELMRSTAVIGWTMLIFGLVLYWADQRGGTDLKAAQWTLRHALIMGLWQAVALIPGVSRSGITITASRLLGYDRTSGARLAMLMSIPTIIASGALLGLEVAMSPGAASLLRDGAIAAALAFVAALIALALMFRLLAVINYTPYVIYRVILGVVLLAIAYS